MSVTLSVQFPWGRYHATPWLRSNNEGAVEWPPSPWRILRALYSSWRIHAPDLSAEDVGEVLASLCEAPTFQLPAHTEAHTRHYLPGTTHREGVDTDTDKTLDTFVAMRHGAAVLVTWPVDLSDDHRGVLARLAAGVRYLGRAESSVEVAVVDASTRSPAGFVSSPGAEHGTPTLVPTGPGAVASITLTPSQVRATRTLTPESTTTVNYSTPAPLARSLPSPRVTEETTTAVRMSLLNNVLPNRYEAVALGDVLHRAAARLAARSGHSPVLTGRRESGGGALDGNHQHVHYLSVPGLDDLGGRRIESIVAWAPAGFSESDLDVFGRLAKVRSRHLGGGMALDVVVTDSGQIGSVAPELASTSSTWISVTPYAPVLRHKGTLREQLFQDVVRELGFRGFAPPVELEVRGGPWLQYRRYRPGKESIRRGRPGYGFRMRFEEPVSGPIAIGQLSHFGLGVFRPE